MSFSNKAERQKCWDSRDRYWQCLDQQKEQLDKCLQLRAIYESSCPSQWVKHFDRKRNYMKFKERIQNEGLPTQCAPITENNTLDRRRRVYRQIAMMS